MRISLEGFFAMCRIRQMPGARDRGRGHRLKTARDLHDFVSLQLTADLQTVEILHEKATLEPCLDFANVILESFERVKFSGENHDIVSEHTNQRPPAHDAFEHVA